MTTITGEKSQESVDRFEQRRANFYKQTKAQNKARLEAKFPSNTALVEELAFIQADLILRGV
jgi:hypothetical protein